VKPSWEDLSAFFDLDEFAETVLIQPVDGDSFEVVGIFDERFFVADLGEYELDVHRPRVLVKAADVTEVNRFDLAVINGKTYELLEEPSRDGTGTAVLQLAETEPDP
jgi:hypothetical protein